MFFPYIFMQKNIALFDLGGGGIHFLNNEFSSNDKIFEKADNKIIKEEFRTSKKGMKKNLKLLLV